MNFVIFQKKQAQKQNAKKAAKKQAHLQKTGIWGVKHMFTIKIKIPQKD